MKFAFSSSVFVNYPIIDVIKIAGNEGFDGVDIWGGRPHVYRNDLSDVELINLRSTIDEFGLRVPSFMPAFFRYPHSLSNPNKLIRQDSLEYMKHCADHGAHLGANLLLIVPGMTLHGQTQEDAFKRLVESVNAICNYCEQYDLRLGLEPANPMVTDLVITHQDALRVLEDAEHDLLGVVMDTGHMHLNNESLQSVLATLDQKLFQFHINDNDGITQQNNIPGDGTYDFEQYFAAMKQEALNLFISVELGWHFSGDPLPAIRRSIERMRAWSE